MLDIPVRAMKMMNKRLKALVCSSVCFIVFVLLIQNAMSIEVSLIRNESNTFSLIVTDVTGSGIGGFYVEILMNPCCNLSDINVISDTFLVAYNVIDSTLKITGAQGNIPGPKGDVILFEVFLKKNVNINLITVEISDVNGNIIFNLSNSSLPNINTASTPVTNGNNTTVLTSSSPLLSKSNSAASTLPTVINTSQLIQPKDTLNQTTKQATKSNKTSMMTSDLTPTQTPMTVHGLEETINVRTPSRGAKVKPIPSLSLPIILVILTAIALLLGKKKI